MKKIHLKRNVSLRYSLCGIAPDKDRFTTADLVASLKPEDICKVCAKVLEMNGQPPSMRAGDA